MCVFKSYDQFKIASVKTVHVFNTEFSLFKEIRVNQLLHKVRSTLDPAKTFAFSVSHVMLWWLKRRSLMKDVISKE